MSDRCAAYDVHDTAVCGMYMGRYDYIRRFGVLFPYKDVFHFFFYYL
ncbi:hypothetical protein [Geobacillus thermodenitrificans]|nr:hypothetical protein [Geobacillus thermodenitrificans]MED3906242.1 hypothetical protein [Geobacillus thermodenitrificans]MED5074196.1 hypothetical protein [Anoxybacillus geothermalis]